MRSGALRHYFTRSREKVASSLQQQQSLGVKKEWKSSASRVWPADLSTIEYGSIRQQWRPMVQRFHNYPKLQDVVATAATLFTDPKDMEFGYRRNFQEYYDLDQVLGSGAFGVVYKVKTKYPQPSEIYTLDLACKVIPKRVIADRKDYISLRNEVYMLHVLGGTLNVTHFYGAFEDDENVYMLMEHCIGGQVLDRLNQKLDTTQEILIKKYMQDILHAIDFCHSINLVHRDLKLENFLFADNAEDAPIKLTDFGGAAVVQGTETLHEVVGTPVYTAPEVLDGCYSFPADIWSCGIIMYKLLSGKFPFIEDQLLDERIKYSDIDMDSEPWNNVSDLAKDLVSKLLERDVSKRLTAAQALNHPWISQRIAKGMSSIGDNRTADVPNDLSTTLIQRLQFYRTLNGLQHAVFLDIAKAMSSSHPNKKPLADLYSRLCDAVGSSKLDITFAAEMIAKQGFRLTPGEVNMLMTRVDFDGDGYINCDEFTAALMDWYDLQGRPEWRTLTDESFDAIDTDGDDKIGLKDIIHKMPANAACRYTIYGDVEYCFYHADTDSSGHIDREEFYAMLNVNAGSWKHYASRL